MSDAHLAGGEPTEEVEVDDDRQARFDAWEAENKKKADYDNSEAAINDRIAKAVREELERRGVQDDPSRLLTPEELAPARQLTPAEQAHFNRTREIPEEGQYNELHLTSHAPV